jgi:hypothetical protein
MQVGQRLFQWLNVVFTGNASPDWTAGWCGLRLTRDETGGDPSKAWAGVQWAW